MQFDVVFDHSANGPGRSPNSTWFCVMRGPHIAQNSYGTGVRLLT